MQIYREEVARFIGTLDTKGNELFFMKGLVEQMGYQPLVIDIGIVRPPAFTPDITREQFIDGHLDALMFVTVPPPFPPVINVNAERKIKLLSIPDEKIAELCKFRGVAPYTLPAATYSGINYPVRGIVVRTHVIVRNGSPSACALSAQMPDAVWRLINSGHSLA